MKPWSQGSAHSSGAACPGGAGTGRNGFLLCLVWVLPADGNKCNGVAEQNSFLTVPEERVRSLEEVCVPSSDLYRLLNLGPDKSGSLAPSIKTGNRKLVLQLSFLPAECKGPENTAMIFCAPCSIFHLYASAAAPLLYRDNSDKRLSLPLWELSALIP